MLGLMQDRPLLISQIIDFAGRYYPDVEIVSRTVEGPIHRYTYADAEALQAAGRALLRLGIKPGDPVGTLAWNTYRHFELYYGISGIGAVCHTINPRLFDDQIVYIVNHAADRLLFVDTTFLPIVEGWRRAQTGAASSSLTDARTAASTRIPAAPRYEDLIARGSGFRLARIRRAHRRLALLHLGHHGQAQRRALQPPLDVHPFGSRFPTR